MTQRNRIQNHLQQLGGLSQRALALCLTALIAVLGCPSTTPPLTPSAGIPRYQMLAAVAVPGGLVNVAGGNLHISRSFISQHTLIGNYVIGASYNSATGEWLWNFDASYDGSSYLDPTGAHYDTTVIPDGEVIPGSVWVKLDSTRIKTKGGLVREFGPDGRLRAMRFLPSTYPRLEFLGAGRTTKIRQCDEYTYTGVTCTDLFTVEYSGTGVSSISDPSGRVAEFDSDANGNLTLVRTPKEVDDGLVGTQFEYDGSLLVSQTNSEGERIEFAYQSGPHRIVSVTRVGDASTGSPSYTFAYLGENSSGSYQTVLTSPKGDKQRVRYDEERRVLSTESISTREVVTLSWQGRDPTGRIDPNGAITSWSHADGSVDTMTLPSGNVVHFSYRRDALAKSDLFAAPLSALSDSLGSVEERDYDSLGRLDAIRNGEGEESTLVYLSGGCNARQGGPNCPTPEDYGEIREIILPSGVRTRFKKRGAIGRPTEVIRGGITGIREFDAAGNQIGGTGDPYILVEGGIRGRIYDSSRNDVAIELAGLSDRGEVTDLDAVTIEYRSDGQALRVRRPNGADHEMHYDALGRLERRSEKVDGVWQDTYFEYDLLGNLTATERPNGMRVELAYDAANRVVSRKALRDGVIEGTATFSYTDGELREYYDSLRGGSEYYDYDSAGRRIRTTFASGEVLDVEYDLRSRVVRETYRVPGQPDQEISHEYDLADREIRIAHQGEVVLERTFRDGRLSDTLYGNGLRRSYTYEPGSGKPSGAMTVDDQGFTLEQSSVTRELVVPAAPEGPAYWEITASTTTDSIVTRTTTESYRLGPFTAPEDPGGDAGKRVFSYSNGVDPDRAYAYDAAGNQLDADVDGCGNLRAFTYNPERNRLLSATLSRCGGPEASYAYDYDEAGFATSRNGLTIDWNANGRITRLGDDTFAWDMLGRPISWSANGEFQGWSLFGGRVKEPGVLDLDEVSIRFWSNDPLYRHYDFRSNIRFVSNAAGEIVQHYRYHPYGVDAEVIGLGDDGVSFVGRHQIGDLMILGARIYDPALGRFLSPDPFFHPVNMFAYTLGNPIWFHDRGGTTTAPADSRIAPSLGQAAWEAGVATAYWVGAGIAVVGAAAMRNGAYLAGAVAAFGAATANVVEAYGALGQAIAVPGDGGGGADIPGAPDPPANLGTPPNPPSGGSTDPGGSHPAPNPDQGEGVGGGNGGGGYSYGGSAPGGRGCHCTLGFVGGGGSAGGNPGGSPGDGGGLGGMACGMGGPEVLLALLLVLLLSERWRWRFRREWRAAR